MNIYEKMSAITSELTAVKKNLDVGVGRSSYKAVGEADVLAAVRPLEAKYKVYSYPAAREIVESGTFATENEYNGKVNKKNNFWMRIVTTYRFVNMEEPTEAIEITSFSDGLDTGDKAPGKAMTYGDKYALLKAYKIITGEDPDQYASPEDGMQKSQALEGYKRTNPRPPACERCGALVDGFRDASGREWSREKVVQGSLKKYGKILCEDCRAKADAGK